MNKKIKCYTKECHFWLNGYCACRDKNENDYPGCRSFREYDQFEKFEYDKDGYIKP